MDGTRQSYGSITTDKSLELAQNLPGTCDVNSCMFNNESKDDDSCFSLEISSCSIPRTKIQNQNLNDGYEQGFPDSHNDDSDSSLEISSLGFEEYVEQFKHTREKSDIIINKKRAVDAVDLADDDSKLVIKTANDDDDDNNRQMQNSKTDEINCHKASSQTFVKATISPTSGNSVIEKSESETMPKAHESYPVCDALSKGIYLPQKGSFDPQIPDNQHGIDDSSFIAGNDLPTALYDTRNPSNPPPYDTNKTMLTTITANIPPDLRQYTPPRPNFHKTSVFFEVINEIHNGHKIVHFYGMSGAGKSQIVRGICKEFDENSKSYILWHMQCQEGSNLLKQGLERLIDKLDDCRVIDIFQRGRLLEELQNNRTTILVDILSTHAKVLLVIEDAADKDKILAKSLVRSLGAQTSSKSIQLLIVSPKKDSLYTEDDADAMSYYHLKRVTGFTKSEAEIFLNANDVNEQGAKQLAEALAYSPLRLTLAKNYCRKYRESYQSYFDGLGSDEFVIEKEKEILKHHPDLAKCHGYEVIMKAVRPKGENENEKIQFSVIEMMSFLSNIDISDYLIGKLFQQVKEMDFREEQRMVQCLKVRLEEECDVDVHSFSDKPDYGEQLISTHNDILLAIYYHISNERKQHILINVLQAITSLIKKENRCRTDSNLLFSLQSHMDRVVGHAAKLLESNFTLKLMNQYDFEIQLGLSKVYEVLGFVVQRHLNTNDAYMKKAYDYLSNVICAYASKRDKAKMWFEYTPENAPIRAARKIYKLIKEANKKIPDHFIIHNWKKHFPITKNILSTLKEDYMLSNLEEMLTALRKDGQLRAEHIRNLEGQKMLLNSKQLKNIYLCERLMSVLHSRSRQVLYLQQSVSQEEQHRFEWYCDLGLYLGENLKQDTGLSSLFEYLLKANNKLPRTLNNRPNEDDKVFTLRIEGARKYAQSLSDGKEQYYGHGVIKKVYGTDYSNMNLLRCLVKANRKLHKRPHIVQKHEAKFALDECNRFFNLAKKNVPHFVVASNCMIEAGKYYAAVGKYELALKAFECGFNFNGKGIEHQCDKYPNAYAWALYNIGLTLCKAEKELVNFSVHKEKFFTRYEVALTHNICNKWRRDLFSMKKLVESLN